MANVLTLIPYRIFPSNLGGQRVISSFNKYLSKYHNLTAVMLKSDQPQNVKYKTISFFGDSKFRYVNLLNFFKLKYLIKELEITTVIVEHPFLGWLGVLLKKFCKIRLIIHSHNIEAIRFKSLGKRWWRLLEVYEKWIHNNADLTFCITPEDREYMITNYQLAPEKCHVLTYGVEWDTAPSAMVKHDSKKQLLEKYNIPDDRLLFLFNGALSYGPNFDAVQVIITQIHPLLRSVLNKYTLFICGKGLPEEDRIFVGNEDQQIIYTGFVDDIGLFFHGCDVFINPVISGGGIKTKLVEALAANLNCVSTKTGAIGVDPEYCNEKLQIANDSDWNDFVEKMIGVSQNKMNIGSGFFDHFNLDKNIKRAAELIH